jgi:hypothetical protein
MSPLKLSDQELDSILAAARPIAVDRRDAFLQRVAELLQNCTEVGPGAVNRAIREAQRAHFDPQELGSGHWSKYE